MKSFLVPALLASLVLAACSSDATSNTGDPSSPTGNPGDGTGTGTGDTSGGGDNTGLRPSGALYRIVNIYDPLNAAPPKIDVYPKAFALDNDQPTRSIDYGTATELYDPPVYEGGNMFESLYAAGTKGNGNSVMSKTETLKGGEVITAVLATGPTKDESGRNLGSLRSYFRDSSYNKPIAAGSGHLIVDMLGLDYVMPETKEQQYGVKVGDKCLPSVDDTEFTKLVLSPGTQNEYELAPGAITASVIEGADCSGTPILENVPVTIQANGRALLVVYNVRGTGFRSVSVAL